MTIIQALVLGLVQGLAEMLPISSSAHLVLFPWFFHFPDPGLAFDVALHLGTLVAILGYFWRDWLALLNAFIQILKTRKIETFEQKLIGFLIVASVPGAIFGYLLEGQAQTIFRSPLLIAFALALLGAVLLYADKFDKGEKKIKDMNTKNSLAIGLSQALAIVPGVSRSGVTMTTGLLLGYAKEDAAKFSFLMSAPIIAGAGLLKFKDLGASDIASTTFVVAFVTSVLASLFAIGFLLRYVKKHGFKLFAYYRFALAAIIIITLIIRG